MNSQKTVNTMQAASIVNQGQATTDQTGGQPSTAVPQPDDVQELARKLQEANLNPASDQRPSIPGTTPVDVLRGNPALGSAADQLLAQVYQRAPWLYPSQTLPGLSSHGLNLAARSTEKQLREGNINIKRAQANSFHERTLSTAASLSWRSCK